uniref:Uncharacterized protein n=1 Tax=Arundo donax TaxID=35708 RepID=A0A0A9FKQ0_ARUDO
MIQLMMPMKLTINLSADLIVTCRTEIC